ncbi:transcription termination/antitermination protein NusA [Patescibacteria group bacterium]|nr:transcription termination/antitermination protein NusA [Patescibacteria group bacterium]
MSNEIKDAIESICEEKHIDFNKITDAINQALAAAYRKDYDKDKNLNVKVDFNIETNEIKVWDSKTVCDNYELDEEGNVIQDQNIPDEENIRFNPRTQIMLKDAKKIKKDAAIGDTINTDLEPPSNFGRVAAQTAKQVIIQKIKEAEKEAVLSEFKDKEKTIATGTIQKVENNIVFVNLGRGTGILGKDDQIPGESYIVGNRIKCYIKAIEESQRGIQILLSRSNTEFLKHLFMLEIPEINEGVVIIKNIAREPGSRSKVAVYTTQDNIDPVGSCIGQRGTRINAIINEIGEEKLDIVEYNKDITQYIINSLAPANIKDIKINEDKKEADVLVDKDQFSLAIGKKGQNVRLASKLTGYKINIVQDENEKVNNNNIDIETINTTIDEKIDDNILNQ